MPTSTSTSELRQVRTQYQAPPRSTPRPAAKPVRPTREYTIPLNRRTAIYTDYGTLHVTILDHGLVTFSVWINGGGQRRLEKQKGFESNGTNITEIYSFGNARVYYVDRISVSSGYCVLKVIPS